MYIQSLNYTQLNNKSSKLVNFACFDDSIVIFMVFVTLFSCTTNPCIYPTYALSV